MLKIVSMGWVDVDLSAKGVREKLKKSGELLKELNIDFDICFTSYLKRAQYSGDNFRNFRKK